MMPSGQSGRTLWNVPKLSNRFQVLQATRQPPHYHPTLRVLCDKTSTVRAPAILLHGIEARAKCECFPVSIIYECFPSPLTEAAK